MKRLMSFFFIALVAAAVIGGFTYFYIESKSEKELVKLQVEINRLKVKIDPVSEDEDLAIDLSGWQTFANKTAAYEVKTPPDWQVNSRNMQTVTLNSPDHEKLRGITDEGYVEDIVIRHYKDIAQAAVALASPAKDLGELAADSKMFVSSTKTTISKNLAYGVIAKETNAYIVFCENMGHIYSLAFGNRPSEDELNATERAILDSFVFM
ncbi:MAG: hypothetical protein WC107_01230 [Patescibacteria group bacterium]